MTKKSLTNAGMAEKRKNKYVRNVTNNACAEKSKIFCSPKHSVHNIMDAMTKQMPLLVDKTDKHEGLILKIISWNINGLLSAIESGVFDPIKRICPDILCLQEIRTQHEPVVLSGYHCFWNHGQRKGYSGTAIMTNDKPSRIIYGFDGQYPDPEGRLITIELNDFFLVNAYVPNSQKDLKRKSYRIKWDEALLDFVIRLHEEKPVIICGDFNVARESIDIYEDNYSQRNEGNGYATDERSDMETLAESGFIDAFRYFYPKVRSYTWWSNRFYEREKNNGWRLDYFFVSEKLIPKLAGVDHLNGIFGSDHCPIELEVK